MNKHSYPFLISGIHTHAHMVRLTVWYCSLYQPKSYHFHAYHLKPPWPVNGFKMLASQQQSVHNVYNVYIVYVMYITYLSWREHTQLLDHYLHLDQGMLLKLLQLQLLCFLSFTHFRRPRSPPKFNRFFIVPHTTAPQNFITNRL